MNFLMDEGLGEATDVLIIDESLCVGCDNCEKACAETHRRHVAPRPQGRRTHSHACTSPIACRHCEQPHCMKDCPPNAIRRAQSGEVYIDDTCIGCGNCQTQLPLWRHANGVRGTQEARPGCSGCCSDAGPGLGEEPDYVPTRRGQSQGQEGHEVRRLPRASRADRRASRRARPAPPCASVPSSSSIWSRSAAGDPPESAALSQRAILLVGARLLTRRRHCTRPRSAWARAAAAPGRAIRSERSARCSSCGLRFSESASAPTPRASDRCRAGPRRTSTSAWRSDRRDAALRMQLRLEHSYARVCADVRRDPERLSSASTSI